MIVLNQDNLKNINSVDDLQRYQLNTINDDQFDYFYVEMNNQQIQNIKEIQPVILQNKNDDTLKDIKTQYTRQQTYELFASNKIQKQTKRIQAQKNAQQQSQNLQQQLTSIQQDKYFPPYLQTSDTKDFYPKEGLLAANLLNYIAQNKDILDTDYVQVQLQNQDVSKLTGNLDMFTTVLNTRTLYQQNKQLFDYLQPKQTSDLLTLLFGCVTSYIDKVPSHMQYYIKKRFNSEHVKKDKKLLCLIIALAAKVDDNNSVNLKVLSTILQEKPKDIYNAGRLCGFKIQGGIGKLVEKPLNE